MIMRGIAKIPRALISLHCVPRAQLKREEESFVRSDGNGSWAFRCILQVQCARKRLTFLVGSEPKLLVKLQSRAQSWQS